MKKVFMIHGFKGEPNGGWRPWLMGKLTGEEIWACSLPMPTPYEPKKEEWIKEIGHVVGELNEEVFLVGHSLGVPAILNYLQGLPDKAKIGGAVLVSGPIHILSKDKYRPIDHFMDTEFDFEHIKKVCKNFVVIHGDNDDAVPFDHAVELSDKLSCNLIMIKNGGHLNGSSGWSQLPQAYEALMKMIK